MHGIGYPFVKMAFEAFGLPEIVPVEEQVRGKREEGEEEGEEEGVMLNVINKWLLSCLPPHVFTD